MRHVFFPVVVERTSLGRTVRIPDFDMSFAISVDADPFLEAQARIEWKVSGDRNRSLVGSLPTPSPLSAFIDGGVGSDRLAPEMLFQVPVPLYRDYVRIGINVEPTLLRRIDAIRTPLGVSRTAFFTTAASDAVSRVEAA